MTDTQFPWDDDALKRLEKIPVFVRKMAKNKIAQAAKAAGETKVSVAFIEANKAKLMA